MGEEGAAADHVESMTSRRSYQSPDVIIRALSQHINLEEDKDWSLEILIYLALAMYAAQRLKEVYPKNMSFNRQELVIPAIERAFREALHVRIKLPHEALSEETEWPFKITRFGKIEKKDES